MEDSLFIRIIASPKRGATDIYLMHSGTSNVGLIESVHTISFENVNHLQSFFLLCAKLHPSNGRMKFW